MTNLGSLAEGANLTAFVLAVFGAVAWVIRRRVEEKAKRDALRRMLFAEICSFVAVIERLRLADAFELQIRNPPEQGTIWASDVSKENYFTIFEANAANLGFLSPSVVGHIAACYGFMKGSRDAIRSLAGWNARRESDVQKGSELRAVARLVAASLVQADIAFDLLKAETQSSKSE